MCANFGPTAYQLEIATKLGIDITNDSVNIAGARIFDVIQMAINPGSMPCKASQKQIIFGDSIGLDLRKDSSRVASARIKDELQSINELALKYLELKPGDKVRKTRTVNTHGHKELVVTTHTVSSVGKNLRVYFRGGNGQGAWASQLEKVIGDQ